jgi:hypothetical protein
MRSPPSVDRRSRLAEHSPAANPEAPGSLPMVCHRASDANGRFVSELDPEV